MRIAIFAGLLVFFAFQFAGLATAAEAPTETNRLLAAEATDSLSSGIRYKYGGNNPEVGLDCSAFIAYLFKEAIGGRLPRTARQMSEIGDKVSPDRMQPGDLVFFRNAKRAIAHVGVYIGDMKFVHASRKHGVVRESSLTTPYWRNHFNGVRRLSDPAPQS